MKRYHHPVAFTGAGISVASGLPTFDAAWEGIPVRDLMTRHLFDTNPLRFYEFFQTVEPWTQKEPNPAHYALAKADIPVITQNIDGLHQKAGSRLVYEVHGNLREMVCVQCDHVSGWKPLGVGLPYCQCGTVLKPRVVLFGEDLLQWDEAAEEMNLADVVLVVGCSLAVAPACYLPKIAQSHGAKIIQVNRQAERRLPEVMMEIGLM